MKINPSDLNTKDAHHLQMSFIVPRPIAFVSTVGKDGLFDVAPYSSFMSLAVDPNLIAFTAAWKRDGTKKRTLVNIEATREFVLNLVTETIGAAMNQSSASYPNNIDKFKAVGLTPVKADLVKAPMVAESPANMECRVMQILDFGRAPRKTSLIIAEVLLVHIKDDCFSHGEVDITKVRAVGRLGGDFYCHVNDVFEMGRPTPFA